MDCFHKIGFPDAVSPVNIYTIIKIVTCFPDVYINLFLGAVTLHESELLSNILVLLSGTDKVFANTEIVIAKVLEQLRKHVSLTVA